jgi:three-Cys-motif partner protein
MSSTQTPRNKKKKDFLEWWFDRIKDLKEKADELYKQDQTAYEVGPQAISKLAILAYYIDIYSRIMKRRGKICFVDLFAGCGLCKVKDSDVVILGSATLAYYIPESGNNFDRIILFERDRSYVDVLEKRVPTANIFHGDVNKLTVDDIIDDLCGNKNPFLAFVDPEGLELEWKTLERILSRWSDVLINYHPEAVRRVYGRKHELPYSETLDRFFGTTEWQEIEYDDEKYFKLYIGRIKNIKDVVEFIKVRGKGNYFYYIILATRKTKGGNPWLRAFLRLKQQIERTKGDVIEQLLDIYSGRQARLS